MEYIEGNTQRVEPKNLVPNRMEVSKHPPWDLDPRSQIPQLA